MSFKSNAENGRRTIQIKKEEGIGEPYCFGIERLHNRRTQWQDKIGQTSLNKFLNALKKTLDFFFFEFFFLWKSKKQ